MNVPNSETAEMAVLSGIVSDPEYALPICVRDVRPDYFFDTNRLAIYNELLAMWEAGTKINNVTLSQRLLDRKLLDQVGGDSVVAQLAYFAPAIAIQHYIETLREKFIARKILLTCQRYQAQAQTSEAPQELLTEIQSEILAISDVNPVQQRSIKDLVAESLYEIDIAHANPRAVHGLTSGFVDLDRKTGLMKPGQLVIIAADTAQGKTALALNIAEYCVIELAKPCGVVSLEMSGTELTHRLIASVGRVDLHEIMSGGGTNDDLRRISNAAQRIENAPLIVQDESDVDSMKLRGIGRQLKHEHKIELLVVDYIQLLTPASTKDENRERAMSSAAQALKQMAKELQIVVIGLSQVNESGKLRESRAIGHHADKVITITHDQDEEGKAFLNVDKNRSGPTGSVAVTFLRHFTRFVNAQAA